MGLAKVEPSDMRGMPRLSPTIMAIGRTNFQDELFAFLHDAVNADHCAIFCFRGVEPKVVASMGRDGSAPALKQSRSYVEGGYWKFDPTFATMRSQAKCRPPGLARLDVEQLPNGGFKGLCRRGKIREKILIYGGSSEDALGISILRTEDNELFPSDDVQRLSGMADTLMAIALKHRSFHVQDVAPSVDSIQDVERVIKTGSPNLPRREVEVCARIVAGMGSADMAAELGISKDTVVTYRKRIYQRLQVATQRDLFYLYMSLCRQTLM